MSRDVSTLGWIDVKTGQSICLPKPAYVEDGAYRCLKGKFPNVRRDLHDHTRAFDPDSGRNFAWDKEKQAWIDVKTGECVCPKCEPKRTAQQPTPSTTDKVTDALKTIGSSISIGIGGGGTVGGHDRHDRIKGEDRTRTAEKLKTADKSHTTSKPKTTSGKTVTAAYKCHPCTCSPCTCH
jgi:hypothetical protein